VWPSCVAATRGTATFLEENVLAKIPQVLHEHINTAYPTNVCLIGTVLPNGFAQITPRGSTMVFDDDHIALWERGRGTTTENLTDGTPVTIFMRKPALREAGVLPKGGILRLYGRAKIHKSGAVYEEVWNRLIEAEKKSDPEKKGYAVIVTIERAEDLSGQPLT
jgi:pyridoxamine 5'-phosphate oxidase-like protein